MSSKSRKKRKSKMKTSRKTRPKTRSLQKLNSPESVESTHHPHPPHHHHHQQLNLFPLHPEEKDDAPKLSYFFNTDDTATLNSFIWSNNNDSNNNISDVVSEDESSFCRSYPLDHNNNNSDEVTTTTTTSSLLERSALRGNVKRDLSEEKWVCYEEVTSCVPEYWKKPKKEEDCGGGLLLLKLDYEEIMNAWSDKGPFCIGEEGCQIVPDMLDDVLRQDGFLDTGNVPTLQVPDDGNSVMGNRAARVLRYKEKRQNRLFAKRIRYEVRKLNAEKRPRMKGRFVKRSED